MSSDSSTHWNLDSYQQLQLPHPDHPQDGHTDVVYGVHLQGNHLVSVSADHTARIWDLETQRLLLPPLIGHTCSVVTVQFDAAPHNDVIITGDTNGNIIIWRFSTGEALKTIGEAHYETILALHFDERYLATGGRDRKIKLWNRRALDVNAADVPEFAVRPVGGDGYPEYSLLATFDGHTAAVNALKLKDEVLVSGSGDSTMCIWSLQNGQMLHKVNVHQRGIACLQYNGRFTVSGSTDNTVKIYDVGQKVEVACLTGHTNLVRAVQAVFDDGAEVETVISGGYDGSLKVWEQEPGSREWRMQSQVQIDGFEAQGGVRTESKDVRLEHKEERFGRRIFSVALDEHRLVCAGQGPVLHVWNL